MTFSQQFTWTRTTSFLAATAVFAVFTLQEVKIDAAAQLTAEATSVNAAGAVTTSVEPVEQPQPVDEMLPPPEGMPEPDRIMGAVTHLLQAMEEEYMDMGNEGKAEHMRQMIRALHSVQPSDMSSAVDEGNQMPMPPKDGNVMRAIEDANHVMIIANEVIAVADDMAITLNDDVLEAYEKASAAYSEIDTACTPDTAGTTDDQCKDALRTVFDAIGAMEQGIIKQAEKDVSIYDLIEQVKEKTRTAENIE